MCFDFKGVTLGSSHEWCPCLCLKDPALQRAPPVLTPSYTPLPLRLHSSPLLQPHPWEVSLL